MQIARILLIAVMIAGCATPAQNPPKSQEPVATAAQMVSTVVTMDPNTHPVTVLALGTQKVQINVVDLQTVETSPFELTGQAPEGTVITIDDGIILVGPDGNFSYPLTLDEGPNGISFTASDPQEQVAGIDLVLIYAPGP